jgi:hypothetical protein
MDFREVWIDGLNWIRQLRIESNGELL